MAVHVLGQLSVGDIDQFLAVFGDEGLRKRQEHGCLGTQVFTESDNPGRVTVLLQFPDLASFEGFRTDPTAPPIMRQGTALGPPTFTVLEHLASFDG